MKPKNLSYILLITGFFFFFSNAVYGQVKTVSVDFSVKSESGKQNDKKTYSLVVNIKSVDASPYSVYLYDMEPWKGGNVIRKEENSTNQKIVITDVAPLKYCVIVVDSNNVMSGKWHTVEP